jgi:hypothetical protein
LNKQIDLSSTILNIVFLSLEEEEADFQGNRVDHGSVDHLPLVDVTQIEMATEAATTELRTFVPKHNVLDILELRISWASSTTTQPICRYG